MKRKTFSILFTLVLVLSFSLIPAMPVSAAGIPTVDAVIGAGEWDGAVEIPVASGMGTVKLLASTDYLYVLFEVLDSTDARLGQNLKGNDQTGLNINPTDGAPWGLPCDIIFQTGADPNAWGGTSSGQTDGWETDWTINGVQLSLPPDLDTMTLYSGGVRISEWEVPLASIAPSRGDSLEVGGAIDVGDGNSYVYPVGLDWGDASTYVEYWYGVNNENTGLYYQTIQSAINAASNGDTITVSDGVYYEHVIVNKGLTIKAASSPIVDGGGSGACFGIYKSTGLSNVTIDGFEIRNAEYGIWIYGAGASSTTYNNITLTNNNIYNHTRNGILTTDATVNSLTISGSTVDNSGIGISFANNSVVDGLIVDSNIVTNNNVGLALWWGTFSDVMVASCTFDGNGWEHINLGVTWTGPASITNVLITGCEFLSGPWCGVSAAATTLTGVNINFNDFLTNQWGVFNTTTTVVDATLNWWGDVSGPYDPLDTDGLYQYNPGGLGDAVSEYVLYDPWVGQELEGLATGGGWFIPETGNDVQNKSKSEGLVNLGGKATFGFVAKKKDDTSSGRLEFQYHADNLNLKSTSYDWVSVATNQVKFEGVGTINGEGLYRFRVRAVDGNKIGTDTDRFEIRIWKGTDNFDMPTYRAEGDLGGGQIVVHKK